MRREEKRGYGLTAINFEFSVQELEVMAAQRDELVIGIEVLRQNFRGNENFESMEKLMTAQLNFMNRIIGRDIKAHSVIHEELFGEIEETHGDQN